MLFDETAHCGERIAMQTVEQAPWRFGFLEPPTVLEIIFWGH
jgi:3-methyladenine DNA glycosylase Mpg